MSGVALSMVLQAALMTGGAQPYDAAFNQSQVNGQPLLVLVGAEWCPGCRTMKQSVMPQMAQAGKLKRVNFAQVNSDQSPALAARLMRGGSIPQLIIYSKTSSGWRREQITGATSAANVESLIGRALQPSPAVTTPVSAIKAH